MAVPQMPMRWMRLLNARLLDDETRPVVGHHAAADAKWQRQSGPGGVARREADENRPMEIGEQVRHDAASGQGPTRLVAARQLADHDSRCLSQNAGLPDLSDQPIEA